MAPKDIRHRRLEKQVVATNFSVQDRRNNARLYLLNKQRKEQLMPMGMGEVAARLHIYREPVDAVLDVGTTQRRQLWRSNLLEHAANGGKSRSGSRRDRKVSLKLPEVEHKTGGGNRAMTTTSTAAVSGGSSSSAGAAPPSTATTVAPPPPIGSSAHHARVGGGPLSLSASPAPKTAYEEWMEKGCPTGSWKDMLAQEVYLPERLEKVFYKAKYSSQGTYSQERLMALVRGDYGGGRLYTDEGDEDEEEEESGAEQSDEGSSNSENDDEDGYLSRMGHTASHPPLPRSKTHSLRETIGGSKTSVKSSTTSPLPSSSNVTPRSISPRAETGTSTSKKMVTPSASRSSSQRTK